MLSRKNIIIELDGKIVKNYESFLISTFKKEEKLKATLIFKEKNITKEVHASISHILNVYIQDNLYFKFVLISLGSF